MPKKRWLFAIILGLLVYNFSGASSLPNTGFKIDHITDLPQGSVISLIQTKDGYLWMGTLAGLVRFDGIRSQVFDEGNTPGLKSSEIVYLFEDSQSNLWVGTQTAGVHLIQNGRVSSLDLGTGSKEGRLVSACEDPTGAIWLYTADGQLARYFNGQRIVANGGRERFSVLRSVIMEPGGLLWVGMDQGQYGLNPKVVADSKALPIEQEIAAQKIDLLLPSSQGGYWRLADGHVQKCKGNRVVQDFGPYPWMSNERPGTNPYAETRKPFCAIEDQEANLIVSVWEDGIWWFDKDGNATHITDKQGLSHTTILSMCMDREGNLWLGTNGKGLNRVRRQTFSVVPATQQKTVQSVCEDKEGGLWIGYNSDRIDHLQTNGVTVFERTNALRSLFVRSILLDSKRELWAASWFSSWGPGLFKFQDTGFLPAPDYQMLNRDISALYEDRKGMIWAGTEGGLARWDGKGWRVFTKSDGLNSERVRAIAETTTGELWIGTDGGGLYQLRDEKIFPVGEAEGMAEEKISSLLTDNEGNLWIGTRGRGLARYKDGKITWYQREQGLIGNSINYLLDDGQGSLWMGSYGGLMRVQKKYLAEFAEGKIKSIPCRTYGETDGLPSGECTAGSQPAACRTQDGKLWFPTTLGLVWVDPSRIRPNTNPPPVVIESVHVDGHSQNTNGIRTRLPDTITLKPGQERIDIEFTSLNLAAPEKARFQYRMEGHEKEWTDAGNSRIARYPKLPPNKYRFQVRACNEDGFWNEVGSSIAFIVEPPFWQTWWFITAATLFTVGLIVGIVHYISTQKLQHQVAALKQQQALEKERQRIARDIHDQVGASLTQVSMLGEMVETDKDVPDEVEGHGRQIAQTARDTAKALDEIVWAVNPSNDTLDGLITYFCKYAQEYLSVANLRYRLDVPPNLPNTPIAPDLRHNIFLAAKEAVTNIVKHSKATAARIRLHLEPDRFVLEIEDNGKGMADMDPARAKTRNGLSNMRKRLEEVGGSFSIGPGTEGGTLVRLSAPLGNHKFDANKKAV